MSDGELPTHPGLAAGPVYLDHNATTPVDPRVVEAMTPHLSEQFGNPSSSHRYGSAPQEALNQARGRIADLIGAHPHELVLTSSGSEADLLALRGAIAASDRPRPRLITQVRPSHHCVSRTRALCLTSIGGGSN
ncbi:aminotransferase class V-fold PLP-dependent enzyme [Nocardiopsis lucentensis]|uniref:aminotransferase class V-fold PLP-dependent enzyme n=1 Tax=Nocardiopsis lucentensis TaxID=53441 RepID=UPI00034CFB70|nr:aminotransferase class V-fold PLP-dependent enzyme [Nocardiopsis lucentensis]